MKKTRRKIDAALKAKIALEALREQGLRGIEWVNLRARKVIERGISGIFCIFGDFKIWHKCWMARLSKRLRRLWDAYSFDGFRVEPVVRGVFGDPKVRIVTLKRRSKKHRVDAVAASRWGGTTAKSGRCVTCPAGTIEYCLSWRCGASIAAAAAR